MISGLLGQGNPDFLCGAGFSDSPHLMYSGYDKNGEWFQLFQIGFGGIPARPVGDGPDGHSLWPGFTNVPNEYIEAYFPYGLKLMSPYQIQVARDIIAVVTEFAWAIAFWKMVKFPSMMTGG